MVRCPAFRADRFKIVHPDGAGPRSLPADGHEFSRSPDDHGDEGDPRGGRQMKGAEFESQKAPVTAASAFGGDEDLALFVQNDLGREVHALFRLFVVTSIDGNISRMSKDLPENRDGVKLLFVDHHPIGGDRRRQDVHIDEALVIEKDEGGPLGVDSLGPVNF